MAAKISHLGYDEVTVRVGSQMLSEDELPYITTNGRRVLFTLSDGVSAGREIYVVIDDQLQGPLRNGQALETGVEFWEKFLPMPHTGGIYVVDNKPFPVNFTDNLEVPVLQSNGQVLNVKTNVVFSAQARCRDGRAMVEEYLGGTFRDPEEEGRYIIQQAVQQTVRSRIAAASLEGDAMRVHQELKQMELTMGDQICKAANSKVSWLRFQNASLQLVITNLDELLTQLNRGYEMRMNAQQLAQQLLIEASIKYFDRDSISEPAMALLTRFVETNPGASNEQIEKMTSLVAQLGKRITPAEMLAFGVKAGLLDAASASTLKLKP